MRMSGRRSSIGAHTAVGARLAYRRGVSLESYSLRNVRADDVGSLRRHAFVVERERAHPGRVPGARRTPTLKIPSRTAAGRVGRA